MGADSRKEVVRKTPENVEEVLESIGNDCIHFNYDYCESRPTFPC